MARIFTHFHAKTKKDEISRPLICYNQIKAIQGGTVHEKNQSEDSAVCPGINFNRERTGNKNADYDTADRMLWRLYRYFICGDNLEKLFFCNKKAAVENCKQWFVDCGVCDLEERGKGTWENFLKIHLLEDFVVPDNNGNLIPISFKKSTPNEKQAITGDTYKPMPSSEREFENFFATANDCIRKRGERIQKKIGIQ